MNQKTQQITESQILKEPKLFKDFDHSIIKMYSKVKIGRIPKF